MAKSHGKEKAPLRHEDAWNTHYNEIIRHYIPSLQTGLGRIGRDSIAYWAYWLTKTKIAPIHCALLPSLKVGKNSQYLHDHHY